MFGGRYPNIDRWATSRAAKRRRSGKGRAVPWASPIDPTSLGDLIGGIVMNTAVARRQRWPTASFGWARTIASPADPARLPASLLIRLRCCGRGATARRYRRAQLHNLLHVKLISAAAEPHCKPHNRIVSGSFVGVCLVHPAAKQDQDILLR